MAVGAATMPEVLPVDLDRIAPLLKRYPRWMCWKYDLVGGEWTKTPYSARTALTCDVTKAKSWTSFEKAADAYVKSAGIFCGLAFSLGEHEDGTVFCGVDVDDCRDPETGELSDLATDILGEFPTYCEVSPSATGVKLFGIGSKPSDASCAKIQTCGSKVEVYDHDRYFAVTGHRVDSMPRDVQPCDEAVTLVCNKYLGGPKPRPENSDHTGASSNCLLTDEQVLELCRQADNAAKFHQLWGGELNGYAGDHSLADLALLGILKFYTQDPQQLDRLVRQSGLYRQKWDEQRGQRTYGERTIEKALEDVREMYSGHRVGSNTKNSGKKGTTADADKSHSPKTTPPPSEYQPFPVDVLPMPLQDYVKASTAALGCDEAFTALPLLAASASLIGATTTVVLGRNWTEPSILWFAVVAPSGSHKSPAQDLALRPLFHFEDSRMQGYEEQCAIYREEELRYKIKLSKWKRQGLRLYQGAAEQDLPSPPSRPVSPRYTVSDITLEALVSVLNEQPRGVLMAVDELRVWLCSFDKYKNKSGDTASWCSIYDAKRVRVDRKTGDVKNIVVRRPAVSACGGIQPGILREILSGEHIQCGLAARLLIAQPPERPVRYRDNCGVDGETYQNLAHVFDRLASLEFQEDEYGLATPLRIELTRDAKVCFAAYHDVLGDEHYHTPEGAYRQALAKLRAVAGRLALVLHLVEWAQSCDEKPGPIREETMLSAITLTKWFKMEAERFYDSLQASEQSRVLWERLDWIKKWLSRRPDRAGITAREYEKGRRACVDSEQAELELRELVKAKLGEWVPSTRGAGQPTAFFRPH